MPDITVSVADAQQTALNAEATAQSTDDTTVTAVHLATNAVTNHADRLRRDKMISWWKSKTLDQQQIIHDANQ